MCLVSNRSLIEVVKDRKKKNPNKIITCWKMVKVDTKTGDFYSPYMYTKYSKDLKGFVNATYGEYGPKMTTSDLNDSEISLMNRFHYFEVLHGIHVFRTRKAARIYVGYNKITSRKIVKAECFIKDLIAVSTCNTEMVFTKVEMPVTLKEAKETKQLSR